ncbi:MAG: ParB N-terminal domain-containing protein [Candidatus Zixiibacteriota bacterium]
MRKTAVRNHLKIGELPDLRILPLSRLRFHEAPDEERLLNLVNRLGDEGILKNPPIVADPGDGGNFLILDGANRVTALSKLHFEHIPVQVVKIDDANLTINCWHHAVEKFDRSFFENHISKIAALTTHESDVVPEETAKSPSFLCSLTFADRKSLLLESGGSLLQKVEILNQFTDCYLHTPHYDRVSYLNLEHLAHNYPEFRTLLQFRTFSAAELMQVVNSGKKLPAGITRVVLPKRALGLNISLELLKSSLTLEEKNHWLQETMQKMVLHKSIRFYQEPTFVFDE